MRYPVKLGLLVVAASLGLNVQSEAALTTVAFDSGNFQIFSDAAKTSPLSAGVLGTAGDGAVLELGYYTNGTTANYFAGVFVPLSGPLSLNTAYNNTTIGDTPIDAAGAGTFALSLNFTTGSPTTGNSLPLDGALLTLRFYNSSSLTTANRFNAVSDSLWKWKAPVDGPSIANVSFTLNNAGLQWLGGAGSALYTSEVFTPVPEPSSMVLGLIGAGTVGFFLNRRRKMTAV